MLGYFQDHPVRSPQPCIGRAVAVDWIEHTLLGDLLHRVRATIEVREVSNGGM